MPAVKKIDENNPERLNTLANDIVVSELGKKFLSSQDITNLRMSCRFFGFNAGLKQWMAVKRWQIVTNPHKTFFLRKDGLAFVIGSDHKPIPLVLPNNRPITKIVSGVLHALLLDDQGHCFWFGIDFYDALRDRDNASYTNNTTFVPIVLPNSAPIHDIVAGCYSSFLSTADHQWHAFGWNSHGELCIDTQEKMVTEPSLIHLPNNKRISKIISTSTLTCMRDEDGQWYGCGTSSYLHNQNINIIDQYQPTPLFLLNDKPIIDIVLSVNDIFLLDSHSQWLGSGLNIHGELGCEETFTSQRVINLPNYKPIIKIVPGYHVTFFCDGDQQWYASGSCSLGGLGISQELATNSFKITTPTPIALPNKKPITQIQISPSFDGIQTYFRDNENNWYTCGYNVPLIGNQDSSVVYSPVPVNFDTLDQTNEEIATIRPRM